MRQGSWISRVGLAYVALGCIAALIFWAIRACDTESSSESTDTSAVAVSSTTEPASTLPPSTAPPSTVPPSTEPPSTTQSTLTQLTTSTTIPPTSTTTALDPEAALRAEEYAVYSALIQAMYVDTLCGEPYPSVGAEGAAPPETPPETIVILRSTRADLLHTSSDTLNALRSEWPEFDEMVLIDFQTKNEAPRTLEPLLSLSVEYEFFTELEYEALVEAASAGWPAFIDRFPTCQGLLHLSQVGFSPEMDEALVFAANERGRETGEGYLWLLEKTAGSWTVLDGLMMWMP